jgi:hypothetical protein
MEALERCSTRVGTKGMFREHPYGAFVVEQCT